MGKGCGAAARDPGGAGGLRDYPGRRPGVTIGGVPRATGPLVQGKADVVFGSRFLGAGHIGFFTSGIRSGTGCSR